MSEKDKVEDKIESAGSNSKISDSPKLEGGDLQGINVVMNEHLPD